ncbi:Rho guanine nucleotide exchange factor 3 [Blomia tropicalis]|nr:Rho guanine nucleotide exchange factor 3 [Blomia tropicalis]
MLATKKLKMANNFSPNESNSERCPTYESETWTRTNSTSMYRMVQNVFRRTTSWPGKLNDESNDLCPLMESNNPLVIDGLQAECLIDPNITNMANIERNSFPWHQTYSETSFGLPLDLIRQQDSIHELFSNESAICHDLRLLMFIYREPLYNVGLIDFNQYGKMFPNLEQLFHIHKTFAERILSIRDPRNGIYDYTKLNHLIMNWIGEHMEPYPIYLVHLYDAIDLLNERKQKCKRLVEYLRSREQYSRKLGLDSFLDEPRRHLTKMPLMLSTIQKYLPFDDYLESSIDAFEKVISEVERLISLRRFDQFVNQQFEFESEEKFKTDLLNSSSEIVWRSRVRRKHGRFQRSKAHLILFDRALILSRRSIRTRKLYVVASIPTNGVVGFGATKLFYSNCNMILDSIPKKVSNSSSNNNKSNKQLINRSTSVTGFNSANQSSFKRRINRSKTCIVQPSNINSFMMRRGSSSTKLSVLCDQLSNTNNGKNNNSVRLYSIEYKFDILIKFKNNVEMKQFFNKLINQFELIRRNG